MGTAKVHFDIGFFGGYEANIETPNGLSKKETGTSFKDVLKKYFKFCNDNNFKPEESLIYKSETK